AVAAWPEARSAWVLCGKGDNGGDGYVAARLLTRAGVRVRVLALGPERSRSDAAEAARAAWHRLGAIEALDPGACVPHGDGPDLILDALFGTGLSRPLRGVPAEVAEAISALPCPVLAVDLPSGVHADRATPPGPHVRADRTVQFGWPRLASALAPARFAFGRWEVADIGLPAGALPDAPSPGRPRWTGAADAAAGLPPLVPGRHKYGAGTVLIVGGSERYAGAAELACRGAHRAGAGLVTLATPAPFPSRWPETVLLPLPDPTSTDDPLAAARDLDPRHAAALVVGPGMDHAWRPQLPALLRAQRGATVLDAGALDDGLRDVVRDLVRDRGGDRGRDRDDVWITPHLGEAARLTGASSDEVAADPIGTARALAASWNAGVVLKGAGSVIADRNGAIRVVARGHPGMASGGTGD
ncbi:MAG: NAD(P)H-hydrate epimerase, partial [Trueperaceae bacterium]